MKNAQIKEFYKELYTGMTQILKPYGFCRKGDRFRRLSPDGIMGEIEIQRSVGEGAGLHSFTVNLNLWILDLSVCHDFWEKCFPMISCHLGDGSAEGQNKQKWYDLYYHTLPHLQKQIVDGRFPSRHKEEGKEWKTAWIPAPGFEEIKAEVWNLTKGVAFPFFSVCSDKEGVSGAAEKDGNGRGIFGSERIGCGKSLCRDLRSRVSAASVGISRFLGKDSGFRAVG